MLLPQLICIFGNTKYAVHNNNIIQHCINDVHLFQCINMHYMTSDLDACETNEFSSFKYIYRVHLKGRYIFFSENIESKPLVKSHIEPVGGKGYLGILLMYSYITVCK